MAAYTDSHGFDKGSAGHPAKGLNRVGFMEVDLNFADITTARATAGATASGNIATVVSPQLAIGKGSIGNKSYTGSPGKSGTSAPKVPKIVQKKKKNGTAVNALDMKGNIFGGGNAIKR